MPQTSPMMWVMIVIFFTLMMVMSSFMVTYLVKINKMVLPKMNNTIPSNKWKF